VAQNQKLKKGMFATVSKSTVYGLPFRGSNPLKGTISRPKTPLKAHFRPLVSCCREICRDFGASSGTKVAQKTPA
jgi:hypothetical protein